MNSEQVGSRQSAAIKAALELRPHQLEKLSTLERAITLQDALSALTGANIFTFSPAASWRHDIRFATIPDGKASPSAYINSALGKPYHEESTGTVTGRPTSARFSISFDDGTGAPWEKYSANRLALKVETEFEGGGTEAAFYSVRNDQLEIVIKTANPRFAAKAIFEAASKFPLDTSW